MTVRSIYRIPLVLGLVVLTGAIFTASAGATPTAEWLREGQPLTEKTEPASLSGYIQITGNPFDPWTAGGFCELQADIILAPEGEGEVTKFDISNCEFSWAGTECEDVDYTSTVPWDLEAQHAGSYYAAVPSAGLKITWDSSCWLKSYTLENAELKLYPPSEYLSSITQIQGPGGYLRIADGELYFEESSPYSMKAL